MIALSFICFAILVAAWVSLPAPTKTVVESIELGDLGSEGEALAA